MSGLHHVLLIGIDAYDGGGMLTGCVNDIDAIQRLLIDRVGIAPGRITRLAAPRTGTVHETDVSEALPTLDLLRAEFTRLGSAEVSPGDHVLIYYSGHGTQCIVVDKTGQRFSREAILPKDKLRGIEHRFLFDWELNTLISKITERTSSVTVILDCCCSAGATRSVLLEEHTNDRFWPTDGEIVLNSDATVPGDMVRGLTGAVSRVAKCQVVAACRDDERARESLGDADHANGELTRALVRQISVLPDSELLDLRWGRIWRAVEAEVNAANNRQHPWLSGSFGRRVFSFGDDEEGDSGFGVTCVDDRYRIDAGTLSGVTDDAEIAVYGATPPTFPPLNSDADFAARKGILRVTHAERSSCEAIAIGPFALPEGARGRLCEAGRAGRLRVALVPEDETLAATIAESPLVELTTAADAELTLVRNSSGGWALTDEVHGTGDIAGEPLMITIPSDQLRFTRQVVEHYHSYLMPLRMARNCSDLPNQLRLWVLDCNGHAVAPDEAQAPDLPQVKAGTRAPYELQVGDRLCIVLENAGDTGLSVILLDCDSNGRVSILGEKRVPSRSRHVFWFNDHLGNPFVASLPKDRSLGLDRIVAIATTQPAAQLQYLAQRKSFDEVLKSAGTREAESRGVEPPVERWTSVSTALRISRPTA